eukprot:6757187-Karenia_brevis.AAC.1
MGQGQSPNGSRTDASDGNGMGHAVVPRAGQAQGPRGGYMAAKPTVWHGPPQAHAVGGQGASVVEKSCRA